MNPRLELRLTEDGGITRKRKEDLLTYLLKPIAPCRMDWATDMAQDRTKWRQFVTGTTKKILTGLFKVVMLASSIILIYLKFIFNLQKAALLVC